MTSSSVILCKRFVIRRNLYNRIRLSINNICLNFFIITGAIMSEEKKIDRPSDDDVIDFNIKLRHDVAVELTTDSDGKQRIPKDTETLNALRGFLKDNDSSVFTKRRLNVDEVNAENDARAAELLETMIGKAGLKRPEEATGRGPDLDRAKLPEFDITEEVTSSVGNDVDLDQIEADARAKLKGGNQEA